MAGLNKAYKRRPSMVSMNGGPVLCLDAGSKLSYPGTGTTWTDLSGNGNNGTLTNGPTYDPANGGSLVFDGVDDYSYCASSASLTFGTGDFTLEMWINHGTIGNNYQHLFSMPVQNTFGLKAWDTGTYGEIYFYSTSWTSYGAGGIPTATNNDWVLDRNIWNHIVFMRQSSVGYGYKNSILKGSKTGFNNNFSSQILNIGWGYGSEFRSKKIGVAKVYNRALSAAEISTNFNLLRGRYGI